MTAELSDPVPDSIDARRSAVDASSRSGSSDRDRLLSRFIVAGRLVQIPVRASRRRVILEHIVTVFVPGVRYPEREVDAVLRAWHEDHAALRRCLVDEDLMARDRNNMYWRCGGPVLIDPLTEVRSSVPDGES
jgi:hypothetical protein